MALNTDLVRLTAPNFATTLANSMLISDTSLTLQSGTGLPTSTAITLTIDATDPVSGAPTPLLKEVVTGTLSGTTLSNLVRGLDGTTTQGHAAGANVVMWWNADMINDFMNSYLTQHAQLGSHTAIAATSMNNSGNETVGGNLAVTGTTSLTGVTTIQGNPVWQYLGSAQITGNLTTQSTTVVQATGVTATVTVPTGYTQVKITLFGGYITPNTNAKNVYWSIWRGTVGGGTSVGATQFTQANANYATPLTLIGLDTPGAASVTYNMGYYTDAGPVTATVGASPSAPVGILVECC